MDVCLNEGRYKLNKPIHGHIEKESEHYFVIWEPNPKGKSKLEQGSPIIGTDKNLQAAFSNFLEDLLGVYERTVEPTKKWNRSIENYNRILKSTVSRVS